MSDNYLENIDELEVEFTEELRGYGSLAVVLAPAQSSDSNGESGGKGGFIGYDIRPEDIEALYFEGIGTPRWESIKADSAAEQLDIYNDSMKKIMSDYPLIHRVSDTDVEVKYSPEEVQQLRAECEKVFDKTSDEKAKRATQKFMLACHKAAEGNSGLLLVPN